MQGRSEGARGALRQRQRPGRPRRPGLGTTSVAFALVPRRDAARPSLGTIVGPGGPGSFLIDRATQVVATFAPLMDRRDLVLVDPRGTGRSDPIACRSLADVALGFTPPAQMSAAIGACGRELGPRAGAYGNAAVADDLDAVRAALGIERLDLFGASYGTYLMTVYAGRHPEHVRSIVLDAGYPIAYDAWGLDKLAAARRGVRLVCARTRACRGSAVLADVARLATRLRRHPMSFIARAGDRQLHLRMDENALAIAVYGSGDPRSLARLPAMVRSALEGDLTPLRRSIETWQLGAAGVLADPARAAAPASRRSSRARAATSRAPSPTPTPTLPGAPPTRAPSRRSTRARWRPSPPPPGCTEGSSRPTGV